MKTFLVVIVVLIVGVPLLLMLASSDVAVTVDPLVRTLGQDTPVVVKTTSPHGVRSVHATIEQNGKQYTVFDTSRPSQRVFFFGHNETSSVFRFGAGRKQAPGLQDGKAWLVISAQANDFRASVTNTRIEVDVNTQPPRVSVDGAQHYVNQGGVELVTFTVSGYWTDAGVRVGPYTFRSFALPGRPANERFAMFAFPWDVAADTVPVVFASNPSGAEARGHFWFKLFPKKFHTSNLELSDAFLDKVIDQIAPNGKGDRLERFLKINGEMRKQNNQTLRDMRLKTEEKLMWSGAFWRYGKTESFFADSRNYVYQGKVVDHQTHLGFDLSDVQHAPIVAANDGRVLYAADLGIYGNCVVLDHGYGLQSIYGHMSEISVKPGDMVKKGQPMGKSGATGLAGGDHLHFSMQVDGVQVTPVEWWDEHWIRDRILSKLPSHS